MPSHTASIIDSCARTEYANAECGRHSSAPARISVGALHHRVVERRVGPSRKRSRTLRAIRCNDVAALSSC